MSKPWRIGLGVLVFVIVGVLIFGYLQSKGVKKDTGFLIEESSLAGSPEGALFTIQVAAFRDKPRAEALIANLKKEGHPAYISPDDLKKQSRWYRVYVGTFKDKEKAQSQLGALREKFADSFVRIK